jgi:hypothetical protein
VANERPEIAGDASVTIENGRVVMRLKDARATQVLLLLPRDAEILGRLLLRAAEEAGKVGGG